MNHVLVTAVLLALISVGGEARAQSSPLGQAVNSADSDCAQRLGTAPQSVMAQCFNDEEREAWRRLAPADLAVFDRFAAERLRLAEAIDDKQLTIEAAAVQQKANFDLLVAQVKLSRAERTRQQMVGHQDSAEDARIRREEAMQRLSRSLHGLGDDMQSAADANTRASNQIARDALPEPRPAPPVETFDPGYSRKPPPTVVCAGYVMVMGPPDQAARCAGGQ